MRLHQMSHMKKGVAIPAPRKEISTPAKKKPGRPPKETSLRPPSAEAGSSLLRSRGIRN
ncbi:MAG: hypothetical protein HETSPECPRED_007506, partial [Heterodermia speciosa]